MKSTEIPEWTIWKLNLGNAGKRVYFEGLQSEKGTYDLSGTRQYFPCLKKMNFHRYGRNNLI